MKICPNCRRQNSNDAVICVECKTELPEAGKRLPKLSPRAMFFIFAVLAVGVLIGAWFLLLPKTLTGHTGPVTALAVTSDSRFIISGGGEGDHSIRMWDAATLEPIRIMESHSGPVLSLKLTTDDQYLVSASDTADNIIRTWLTDTGQPILALPGGCAPVAIAPSNQHILSGSKNNSLCIWNSENGQLVRTHAGHTAPLLDIAIDKNGYSMLTSSEDSTIRIWSLRGAVSVRARAFMRCTTQPPGLVSCMDLPPQSTYFLSGTAEEDDCTMRVWSMPAGELQRTYHGHDAPITCLSLTKNPQVAVSGDEDGKICIWTLRETEPLMTYRAYWAGGVRSIAVMKNNKYIVAGYDDGKIRLWPVPQ